MASSKNYTEVLIGGKVFTLSGFESEEYLQKVSTYLNHKIEECTNSEGYRKQSAETRSVLLALNIADDYFKAVSYTHLWRFCRAITAADADTAGVPDWRRLL